MREMKDSGVEWIGEVPQNWKQSKVKYLMSLTNGRAFKQQELLTKGTYRVLRVGNFNTNNKWYYSDLELPEKQYCEKGDLLYLWATTFGPAFWNEEKVIYHYHIWKVDHFRDYLQRYAFYALGANAEWQRMQSHGSTMVHVTKEGVENTVFPAPPLPEQHCIVAFLDERCAVIDADIAKRREVIEKLGEYKKAVIARVVTKGLDPNVEMKDSGVEWIGEIPVSWIIAKAKSCLSFSNARNPGNQEAQVLSLYREYGVIPKSSRDDNHNRTSEDTSDYKNVRPGDLVINKMKAWQGSLGLSEYEGIVSPAYYVYRVNQRSIEGRYLHYLVRSIPYAQRWNALSYGIREGQWDLHREDFESDYLIFPPLLEQRRIVSYLDKRCAAIDEAVSRQEQLIEKLGEYRKSVIHHAVTGKIDCTEA